jgi:lysophospholipase L1-like esterase
MKLLQKLKRHLRVRYLEKLPPVKAGDIVLVGDSILALAPGLADAIGAVNWAVSGATLADTRTRCLRLRRYRPGMVIISAGINDLHKGAALDDVMAGREACDRLFHRLGHHFPTVRFLPLMPINTALYQTHIEPAHPDVSRPKQWHIRAINSLAALMGPWLTTMPEVVDDKGELAEPFTRDGLHLNTQAGADELARVIRLCLP